MHVLCFTVQLLTCCTLRVCVCVLCLCLQPFKLPGGSLFTIPLDYTPDERAVERCKYWTAWKVRGVRGPSAALCFSRSAALACRN